MQWPDGLMIKGTVGQRHTQRENYQGKTDAETGEMHCKPENSKD